MSYYHNWFPVFAPRPLGYNINMVQQIEFIIDTNIQLSGNFFLWSEFKVKDSKKLFATRWLEK